MISDQGRKENREMFQIAKSQRVYCENNLLPQIEELFAAEICNGVVESNALRELYSILDLISLQIISDCDDAQAVIAWIEARRCFSSNNRTSDVVQHLATLINRQQLCSSKKACKYFLQYIVQRMARAVAIYLEHSKISGKTVSRKDIWMVIQSDEQMSRILLHHRQRRNSDAQSTLATVGSGHNNIEKLDGEQSSMLLLHRFIMQETLFGLDLELLRDVLFMHNSVISDVQQLMVRLLDQKDKPLSLSMYASRVDRAIRTRQFKCFRLANCLANDCRDQSGVSSENDSLIWLYLVPFLVRTIPYRLQEYAKFWKDVADQLDHASSSHVSIIVNRNFRYFLVKSEQWTVSDTNAVCRVDLNSNYFSVHRWAINWQTSTRQLSDFKAKLSDHHQQAHRALSECCTVVVRMGILRNYCPLNSRIVQLYVVVTDKYIFVCKFKLTTDDTDGRNVKHQPKPFQLKIMSKVDEVRLVDGPLLIDGQLAFQLKFHASDDDLPSSLILICQDDEDKRGWMGSLLFAMHRKRFEKDHSNAQARRERSSDIACPMPVQPFTEADSADNLVIGISLGEDSSVIRGATLDKFLEKATDPNGPLDLQAVFLMCYRHYTDPLTLIKLLKKRFDVSDPDCSLSSMLLDNEQKKLSEMKLMYERNYSTPVKIRVVNLIKQWLSDFFFHAELEQSPQLLHQIQKFLNGIKSPSLVASLAKNLVSMVNEKLVREGNGTGSGKGDYIWFKSTVPATLMLDGCKLDQLHVLTIHPVEMARQITIFEFKWFRSIQFGELLNKNWQKPEKQLLAPSIFTLTNFWNKMSFWVRSEILQVNNLEERSAVICRFIDTAKAALFLNNFSLFFAITSGGLTFSAVSNLTKTWQKVPALYRNLMTDFEGFYDDGHYRPYIDLLHKVEPPCVPFIPDYLTKLLKIEDGNSNFIGDQNHNNDNSLRLINITKHRKVHALLKDLQTFQNTPYNLKEVAEIQQYIQGVNPLNGRTVDQFDNDMYSREQELENSDKLNGSSLQVCVPKKFWRHTKGLA